MCWSIINQSEAGVLVSVGGEFYDVIGPGCNFVNPCNARLAGTISLRPQSSTAIISGTTKDQATVDLKVAVLYKAIPSEVHRAYFSLTGASHQIQSFVTSTLRSVVPQKTLDELFLERSHLADIVRDALAVTLHGFGFELMDVLILDVEVKGNVRNAMNNQAKQKYDRISQQYLGEIAKIQSVKAAEAHAEADRLSGIGTAAERNAITLAFQEGLDGFDRNGQMSESELIATMLMIQYFDMMNDVVNAKELKPVSYFLPQAQGKLDRSMLRQRMSHSLRQQIALSDL